MSATSYFLLKVFVLNLVSMSLMPAPWDLVI